MGLDLVVWNSDEKTEGKWSVMADACPHRLAPLSQGRVDPETGCIECPYHGWQFDTEGNLTRLPHAEPDIRIDRIAGSHASNFPTHLAGDMIFAFLPSSVHGEMFLQSVLPEDMYPTVRHDMRTNKTYFVRELPYSADFVIENFMDPSHIPFAHHGLQSLRSDASSVPMSILVSNFTHVETSFEDYSRGVKRV
jgi:phenylpropionate dioxygenase-like ring-hydroxylating dioxygenase large terminal subunit